MTNDALLALFFLSYQGSSALEEDSGSYGPAEECEARDLLGFVRQASGRYPAPAPGLVRITRTLRIFIGPDELKIRPMAKTVLLLFLRHPEGILLKHISDYRAEMTADYRRCMRSLNPDDVDRRIQRLLDIFSNELNVNISRVNAALSALVAPEKEQLYRVSGRAGTPKSIRLDRTLVIWE
jgi:hypothetical protein